MRKLPVLLLLLLFLSGCTQTPPQAMVSFTFDDGYASVYQQAFTIFAKEGYPATVYMVSSNVNKPERLSADNLITLQEAGWEIGSHTVTHPNLTTLSDAQVASECRESKEQLTALGLTINSFAPPGGAVDDRVRTIVNQEYTSMRGTEEGLNLSPEPYNILVQPTFAWTTSAEIAAWMTTAKKEKAWLVLVFHHVDDTGSTYSISPNVLRSAVVEAKEQKMDVVTISDALERLAHK